MYWIILDPFRIGRGQSYCHSGLWLLVVRSSWNLGVLSLALFLKTRFFWYTLAVHLACLFTKSFFGSLPLELFVNRLEMAGTIILQNMYGNYLKLQRCSPSKREGQLALRPHLDSPSSILDFSVPQTALRQKPLKICTARLGFLWLKCHGSP